MNFRFPLEQARCRKGRKFREYSESGLSILSEFYHLRRTAIKDLSAYIGFLVGFIGVAPFAWGLLGEQLASGAFVRGLWYFFGIVIAAGIFTGSAGLGLGYVAGVVWEQVHRHRRAEKLKAKAVADAALASVPDESTSASPPKLTLVQDDPSGRRAPPESKSLSSRERS